MSTPPVTNDDMVASMRAEGFASDYQCWLRGMRSQQATSETIWMAIKEGQNARVHRDGSFTLFYTSTDMRNRHERTFKVHTSGCVEMIVWIKRRGGWTRMGAYKFGDPYTKHCVVKKRGKSYATDCARMATRVA
jgi:hypothetical protein